MGATSSKQPSKLHQESSSSRLKIKSNNLRDDYKGNDIEIEPHKSLPSDSKNAACASSQTSTHPQIDKQTDKPVMLKYSVKCKNEHSEPVDIVLIDERTKISSAVREKILPGSSASFEVLVFKEPVNGKVYVRV